MHHLLDVNEDVVGHIVLKALKLQSKREIGERGRMREFFLKRNG